MIKQVIRLIRPGLFLPCFAVENPGPTDVLIRPRYLSICAADQRYFQGSRAPEVLKRKLPMALFHEAVGEVLRDPSGELAPGTFCVLLPGGVESLDDDSNYRKGAFFRSSNADGFCQEVLCLDRRELLPVSGDPVWPFVFTELMSVCCQALRRLEAFVHMSPGTNIGLWGDGAMSFMMALTLSQLKPDCPVSVFGKHDEKLVNFSFVERRINIADETDATNLDVAVECVGGGGSQQAIAQAVGKLKPTGALLLMGVSEIPPVVPTRLVLEKGLILIGTSRSTRKDFETAMGLIARADVQNALLKIVSLRSYFSVNSDLGEVFKKNDSMPYKTILAMNI